MRIIKDIITDGIQDLNAHKKKNRLSMILMFMSIVIYIGVNSTVNSINNSIQDILYSLEGRIITYVDNDREIYNLLKKKYKDDERITDIFFAIPNTIVKWQNTKDILGVEQEDIYFDAYNKAVLEYDYKGEERKPQEGEIILPRYLYGLGIYDNYSYYDADKLIGKTLTFEYKTNFGEETRTYKLKVIGTYNNITARRMDAHFYINNDFAESLLDLEYADKEANWDAIMADVRNDLGVGEDEEINVSKGYNYYTAICSKEGYTAEEMNRAIAEEAGVFGIENLILDEELQGYFGYTVVVGNAISFMLLCIAVINIIISSISEIKERNWEFALKMSMGYTKGRIILTFFVEKIANLTKSLIAAVIVIFLYSRVMTYAYETLMEYWKKSYVIRVDIQNVVIAALLVIMSSLVSIIIARLQINRIQMAKELKSGE